MNAYPPREPLPTKAQINAIDDLPALYGLKDKVELEITRMETDLEFRDDDDEWAKRARHALALHRFVDRMLYRRIGILKGKSPKAGVSPRPQDQMHALTVEMMNQRPVIDAAAIETTEEVDRCLAWVTERFEAVTLDREDEIALIPAERDEGFLAATGSIRRQLGQLRQQLSTRRGELTRAAKAARVAAANPETRERLFIEAAREVLDRDTYMAVWAVVDRMQTKVAA